MYFSKLGFITRPKYLDAFLPNALRVAIRQCKEVRIIVVVMQRRFCVYVYACVVQTERGRERERESLRQSSIVKGDNTSNI